MPLGREEEVKRRRPVCFAAGACLDQNPEPNAKTSPMQFQIPETTPGWHGTTILTVRKGGVVAIGGDGQVTIGQTIVKANAKKVRRIGKGDVLGGCAGATADAFTLF